MHAFTLNTITLLGIVGAMSAVRVRFNPSTPGSLEVQSDLSSGATREAKLRVQCATRELDLAPPCAVVVELGACDAPQALDLATGVGCALVRKALELDVSPQTIESALSDVVFIGELGLDGRVLPVRGAFPRVEAAAALGATTAVVAMADVQEASLASGINVVGAASLDEAVLDALARIRAVGKRSEGPCMSDVRIDPSVLRELEVALVARANSILLTGPVGSGKTMLARRLTGLMPEMTRPMMLGVTAIHSVAGLLRGAPVSARPFRAPHHTCSDAALVGTFTGTTARPGEVSLAHRGVLLLDEATEFKRATLDRLGHVLRQGQSALHRRQQVAHFPACPEMTVASVAPCACGLRGLVGRQCTCTPERDELYQRRVEGVRKALRVELEVKMPQWSADAPQAPTSAEIRERVRRARALLDLATDELDEPATLEQRLELARGILERMV